MPQELKPLVFSIVYNPTKQSVEKVAAGVEGVPQRLKPNSWQSIYVRAEARTLQGVKAVSCRG
jgi:hypothetical protein